jgi:hypothetical protein
MENPIGNSVFVHEDFEKLPKRLLEKRLLTLEKRPTKRILKESHSQLRRDLVQIE